MPELETELNVFTDAERWAWLMGGWLSCIGDDACAAFGKTLEEVVRVREWEYICVGSAGRCCRADMCGSNMVGRE